MTILMPHIAARLFDVPLMIDAGKLSAILLGLGGRFVDGGIDLSGLSMPIDHVAFANGRPSESLGKLGDPLGRMIEQYGQGDKILQRLGNVGIIPIEGSLVHKGKYLGQSSGTTSYEGIQTQVARAGRDTSIKGVVFEVDTFGGEAAGAFETARMIAKLSAAKPTLAILTDHALSSGYLMASAARQVVMPAAGAAGSIGVITMHADMSGKLEKDGIKVTVISSGGHKADGHPAAPLADDVRQAMQARADRMRDTFAATVGEFRGRRFDKAAALATEARVYSGEDAVKAGLIDGIIDPSEAFAAFVGKLQ